LQTRKLAESFEGLNSSLAQSTGKLIAKWHENTGFTSKSTW